MKNLEPVLRRASMLSWVAGCLFAWYDFNLCVYFSWVFKKEKLKCKMLSEKGDVTFSCGEQSKI